MHFLYTRSLRLRCFENVILKQGKLCGKNIWVLLCLPSITNMFNIKKQDNSRKTFSFCFLNFCKFARRGIPVYRILFSLFFWGMGFKKIHQPVFPPSLNTCSGQTGSDNRGGLRGSAACRSFWHDLKHLQRATKLNWSR